MQARDSKLPKGFQINKTALRSELMPNTFQCLKCLFTKQIPEGREVSVFILPAHDSELINVNVKSSSTCHFKPLQINFFTQLKAQKTINNSKKHI